MSSDSSVNNKILNIPHFVSQTQRASFSSSVTDLETESDTETEARDTSIEVADDGAIGLEDDGKSGKLTLSILLAEKLIEPGESVMSIDYLGQTFKGDLLPMGKIRSVETGLIFNNPSAWAIYCKKIINPAKKSGCGWASVKYRGKKMDYFKNIWVKRKAQREAEMAKNEAAHALTFLSEGILSDQKEALQPQQSAVNLISHNSSSPAPARNTRAPSDLFIELDNWTQDGRMQPFSLSVSSSAMLVLDLHAHLATEKATGYLAGFWDPNNHNLAIIATYPVLLNRDQHGTEEAKRVETKIYEELYGQNLSLVGWYHTNMLGPAAPTSKDCKFQLELQIKMLGNTEVNYSPCIAVICSPYDQTTKSNDSSIVFYWVYPPGESHMQDIGRPMRMSYSVVMDPYLSEEVLRHLDDIIDFHLKQTPKLQIQLLEKCDDGGMTFIEKIGFSLMSKFPGDQDPEKFWMYLQTELLRGQDLEKFLAAQNQKSPKVQLQSQPLPQTAEAPKTGKDEEEIDDDEETALNEQEEIDDDEDTALGQSQAMTLSQISSLGTTMTFTKGQEVGGQETVNLSIKDTDISLPDINIRDSEKHEEDSDDDERLVIKE